MARDGRQHVLPAVVVSSFVFRLGTDQAPIAGNRIQRDVPTRHGECRDPLAVMSETDQPWSWSGAAGERKGAVIETASHADAVSRIVESHQR